jgi:cytochrome c oxidase cbb3-type subunit II
MFESKSGVLLVAGLGFFAFAFLSNALVPALLYRDLAEATTSELVEKNSNLMYQFENLRDRYPEQFAKYYGEPSQAKCAEALELGRRIYTSEGCWHCHSQFVRPVSREEDRWGPVARTEEYQNVLQRPVMFGTRRVGPDLSREGGRRANDWHTVHFFDPTMVSTGSPMPAYPWLFDGAPDKPNKRGFALITYVQWLGSWLESYPYYEQFEPLGLPKPFAGETRQEDVADAQNNR